MSQLYGVYKAKTGHFDSYEVVAQEKKQNMQALNHMINLVQILSVCGTAGKSGHTPKKKMEALKPLQIWYMLPSR